MQDMLNDGEDECKHGLKFIAYPKFNMLWQYMHHIYRTKQVIIFWNTNLYLFIHYTTQMHNMKYI